MEYGSLAKLALAQLYGTQGKVAQGEKLIQSVIDHPTVLVSKEAAIIALAHLITPTDPGRARNGSSSLRAPPGSLRGMKCKFFRRPPPPPREIRTAHLST